ncbi:MAG: hypothetical protein ACRENS_06920, partial [Candidatus Eiseniibacteriota bacterium]
CSKQGDQQGARTGSDSLLSTSPVEPPQGNLTPATQFQGETPAASAPEAAAPSPKPKPKPKSAASAPKPQPAENPGVSVPAGTAMEITVNAKISSETAHAGDTWSGTIADPVVIGTSAPFPAGSTVSGVVLASKGAEKGDRALLLLGIQSITVNGKSHEISATADSMVAGSTRARNVGAVAGGAGAGALIGSAIGGGKGALIGGLIGGGAATVGVAKSKGFQVAVDEGAKVRFHTDRETVIHE